MLIGNQGGKALKWLPAHFNFEKRNAPKSERGRPSTSEDCPLSFYFSGNVATLRDSLSTSRSVGRGTGAFIYALSADENRPALAAPRHTSTTLFSCRFKCPCPPRRQRHFHGNADRAYNTLHFASQSRVPNGGVAPFGNPHKKRRYATPPRGAYRLFLLSSPPAVSVEQKSAWEWCGIFI